MARNQRATETAISQGFGESRPFIAPEGTFDNELDNPRHPSNCTVNGLPIPEAMWAIMPFEMTDQGYAEANIGKEPARASVTVDEVSNRIRRRGEDLDRGMAGFEASDPMRELANEYVPAGMRPKFLSQRKVHAEGTTRGYTICKTKDGDPVTLGTSVLGYMPEERAAAIQRSFEEKSHEAQREMYGDNFDPRNPGKARVFEKFEEQERLSRGAIRPKGRSEVVDPFDDLDSGLHSTGEEQD